MGGAAGCAATPFRHSLQFQSQGRFFGGCCLAADGWWPGRFSFQSQGRFFGGCCFGHLWLFVGHCDVSIAGAILWGVLPGGWGVGEVFPECFNRRGDSLGGAARVALHWYLSTDAVSIAGAILWGVLPRARRGHHFHVMVSIAGAILWGVLHM